MGSLRPQQHIQVHKYIFSIPFKPYIFLIILIVNDPKDVLDPYPGFENLCYVAPHKLMIANDELEKMWKKTVVA